MVPNLLPNQGKYYELATLGSAFNTQLADEMGIPLEQLWKEEKQSHRKRRQKKQDQAKRGKDVEKEYLTQKYNLEYQDCQMEKSSQDRAAIKRKILSHQNHDNARVI